MSILKYPTKEECEAREELYDIKYELIDAAYSGDLKMVKRLLDKGADVNVKDVFGDTALIYASIYGYTNIVKLLLDKGADMNIKDIDGDTALMFASIHGHTNIVKLLKQHGAV